MSKYIEYLESTIKELKNEEEELVRTSRKDEANFIKINICDICKTIYIASGKTSSSATLQQEYIRQLKRLPENWKISLDKAKEHGDTTKIVIEETKLGMLQVLRNKFEELGA